MLHSCDYFVVSSRSLFHQFDTLIKVAFSYKKMKVLTILTILPHLLWLRLENFDNSSIPCFNKSINWLLKNLSNRFQRIICFKTKFSADFLEMNIWKLIPMISIWKNRSALFLKYRTNTTLKLIVLYWKSIFKKVFFWIVAPNRWIYWNYLN